ncbi:MAG TPA: FAD-binding protein [bacterium]|jgi:succinate dehydrogenase/fumarate reductase flavoprotein subunit|nr:FAD-binding protein [bacterium]HQC50701.1 FAD-binding protein [bacterium]HQG13445.1 FAD-binding protein [bacterium]
MPSERKRKILIIGAGLAGQMAAVVAARAGASVTITSVLEPMREYSCEFLNSFNVSSGRSEKFSESFFSKALETSCGLADSKMLRSMCEASRSMAVWLEDIGVRFDRDSNGLVKECADIRCGFSTIRSGEFTSRRISLALFGELLKLSSCGSVFMMNGWEFLSPVIGDAGRCCGAVFINKKSMEIRAIEADATIMSFGGYSSIYSPTLRSSFLDGSALVSSMRGGARAVNPEFMSFAECHHDDHNEDSTPAAYFSLGGLEVDHFHKCSVVGMYAAGEAACAYHGASLLSGNEILSEVYGGFVAGSSAAAGEEDVGHATPSSLLESAVAAEEKLNAKIASHEGSENAYVIARELSELLSSAGRLVGEAEHSADSSLKIAELKARFNSAPLGDKIEWCNQNLLFMRRLEKKFDMAKMLVAACKLRRESRGVSGKPDLSEGSGEVASRSVAIIASGEVEVSNTV